MRRLIGGLVGLAAPVVLAAVLLGYGGPIWFELDLLAHFRLHLLLLALVLAGMAVPLAERGALWRSVAAAVLATAGLAPLWQGPPPPGAGQTRHGDDGQPLFLEPGAPADAPGAAGCGCGHPGDGRDNAGRAERRRAGRASIPTTSLTGPAERI